MPSVLLVDDERDFLHVMNKLLKKHGYVVSEATNTKDAIKKARKEKPDVIVLDVMMPGMDGWEVGWRLKNDSKTKDLPVIILSVMADEKNRWRSFDYVGAVGHVSKPFELDLLYLLIDIATKKQSGRVLEERIGKAIEKDQRMKKFLDMINPKLLEYDYSFLDK
jgi:CheY-like chemotaxis protein